MNKHLMMLLLMPFLALGVSCGRTQSDGDKVLSLSSLLADPGKYSGKTVTVDGFYFHAFEVEAFAGEMDVSGAAGGRALPVGEG